MNNGFRRYGIWVVVALVGALCWGMLALSRGETINAGWLLVCGAGILRHRVQILRPVHTEQGARDR